MRSLALCLALCSCATWPPRAPDAGALHPGAGRRAVALRSRTTPLAVAVVTDDAPRGAWDPPPAAWCHTPCTLYLSPGDHRVHRSGPGVASAESVFTVPDRDVSATVGAPSRRPYRAWWTMRVGAAGVLAAGVLFGVSSVFAALHDAPFAGHTAVVGVGLAAVGGAGVGLATWRLGALARDATITLE